MFPLSRKTLPASADELRDAIEAGLLEAVRAPGMLVTIEDKNYPELAAIRVSLDQASMGDRPPRLGVAAGPTTPALRVENVEITGRGFRVQGAAVDLCCRARDVQVNQAEDKAGNLVLLLQSAAEGSIEVGTSVADLETLLRVEATKAAAKQGVTIEEVRINLQARSERVLDVEVQVRAKKMFLSATVRITGGLEIDDQLNARLRGLKCTGEGALGGLASGFIAPYLQRFDGRAFALTALPLGEIRLRDVRLAAGAELRVTAQFGRAAA